MFGPCVLVLLSGSMFSSLSVSECMRRSACYRVLMVSMMMGQFWRWSHFISSLSHANYAYGELSQRFLQVATVCWLGLCFDLHSNRHYVWTFLFGANYSCMAFALLPLLHSEYEKLVWFGGFLGLLVSILACLIALIQNSKHMGYAEHIAFIVYNITFMAFFH